jgi:hypothetical protein
LKSAAPRIMRLMSAPLSVLLLTASLAASRAEETPKESWIGIYMNGRKMGYSKIHTAPGEYQGKPGLKITSTSVTRLEMLGNKISQDTDTLTYTDTNHKPLHQEYRIVSNGSVMSLKADYLPGKIVVTMNSGGSASTKEVVVPPDANLIADSSDPGQGKKITLGQKTTYYYLNPLTISLDKTDVDVVASEQIKLAGKPQQVFRVTATTPFGNMLSWETPGGEMVKGEMSLGAFSMIMFQETKQVAMDMASKAPSFVVAGATAAVPGYTPPSDFALATAVTLDKPIENPRNATSVNLEISGINDKSLILSDKRQEMSPISSKPNTYALHINAAKFDAAKSALLPISEPSVQKELQNAPYLETTDLELRQTAKELKGSDTNAYRVAASIRLWVYTHMRPDYSMGVPRSCSEVYKKRRGVCRDYATLFAGIARAAGIPTKVVGGVVYAEGKFFYHAWAECWVGEWVPFDSTMPNDFVDATHIKFTQGDVTDMYKIAGVVGKLKVNVLAE